MTVTAVIAAILQVAQRPLSKPLFALCIAIAGLGLAAIIRHLYERYHVHISRRLINKLLGEGQQLCLFLQRSQPERDEEKYPNESMEDGENYAMVVDWCERVEDVLRKHLDDGDGFIARFHFGGSLKQNEQSMTIWKTRHRLETLASFLAELK